MDKNIKAHLVWDDGLKVHIPECMGKPSDNQMQGFYHERLSELCCRICYDSLGRGRSSDEMHKHLLDVQHWSVYEHAHNTVFVRGPHVQIVYALVHLLNRPGIIVNDVDLDWYKQEESGFRLTYNYRHLLDWNRFNSKACGISNTNDRDSLFAALVAHADKNAPAIVQRLDKRNDDTFRVGTTVPKYDNEKWITMYLSASRGMSHEQVRHRFCMSQRSTRYCDESGSDWVEHPLVSKYIEEHESIDMVSSMSGLKKHADEVYDKMVKTLESWLVGIGVDKFTARKQSRGAARGMLGNSLFTEMMFTASVSDWKDMLRLRYSIHADAEIRVMYGEVLKELKTSRWAEDFAHMTSAPSPDGIGTVLKEG